MNYKKRGVYLALGQLVSAVGIVAMVQANIGLDPWNCLHQGLSLVSGLSFGVCSIVVGAAATLAAFLLKEPLGLGTLINVIVPGLLIDLLQYTALIPQMHGFFGGVLMMLVGQGVLALGTYFYLAAAMGAGPRDALMVSLSRALNMAPGACRTILEISAVALGWLMGAKVGAGTILSALTIGPTIQGVFTLFRYDPRMVEHMNFAALWQKVKPLAGQRETISADSPVEGELPAGEQEAQ